MFISPCYAPPQTQALLKEQAAQREKTLDIVHWTRHQQCCNWTKHIAVIESADCKKVATYIFPCHAPPYTQALLKEQAAQREKTLDVVHWTRHQQCRNWTKHIAKAIIWH